MPPTRGAVLEPPPGPTTAARHAPAHPDAGPDPELGPDRDHAWSVGLAVAVAVVDVALAFDAFVLRPLLTHGDPRGVVRAAVLLGVIALARTLRHRPSPEAPPALLEDPDEPDPTSAPTTAPRAPAPPDVAPPVPPPTVPDAHPTARTSTPATSLDVRVLGPVVVDGAAAELTPKSLELVVYLACHPEGVHEERIKAALWPAREPRHETFLKRVYATRKALGHSAAGDLWLPWFDLYVGRLNPSVRTDVDALGAARARAGYQPPAEAAAILTTALEVVRGRPFHMAAGYGWAVTELHVARAEQVVVDVAHELAGLALTLGDWRRALWSTDVGLQVCPACERLVQDRMRACAAAADRPGVERAMGDLRRTLAAAGSSDVPSGDTVDLFEQLLARVPPGTPTEPTPGRARRVKPR